MNKDALIAGPYTHEKSSVSRIMGLVMVALLPATILGLYTFGWPAIFLFVVTALSSVLLEALALWLAKRPVRAFVFDGSALLTGWLLALTLPPWAPWWIGVVGAFLAIIVGKQVFWGIGQNLFNPAMIARVALLISFPLEMTHFTAPAPLFSSHGPGFIEALGITFAGSDQFYAVTSATTLGHIKTELTRGLGIPEAMAGIDSLWRIGSGITAGSMGETSAVLLLLGGLYLLYKRIITWHIPVSLLTTLFLLASVMHLLKPESYSGPWIHVLAGGSLLGAFFIATDLVTSPVSASGQLIFGAGCGKCVATS